MKKVLITGSQGFIGKHFLDKFLHHADEYVVTEIDNFDPRVHLGELPGVGQDITDVPHEPQDIIIHLAAQVGVADSMVDPLRYIEGNTTKTALFLRRLERHPPKQLIVASSMSVYGEAAFRDGSVVTETTPVCPESVYGLTKYDQERLCLMWGKQHGIAVTALRFFNVYGPGQALHNPYTGVIANFAKKLLNDEAPIIYEDGQQTRDFIYVADVVEAIWATMENREAACGEVFNVCTKIPTTIVTMARLLALYLHRDTDPHINGIVRDGDIRHCIGDPEKAFRLLGWSAKTPVVKGIQKYSSWLLNRASLLVS